MDFNPLVLRRLLPGFCSSLIVLVHYQGKVSQMFQHKDLGSKNNKKTRLHEIFQVVFGSDSCEDDVNASLQGGALHVMH